VSAKVIVVSAAIVDFDQRRILLAQRSGKTSYPFSWCTPGGKVEANETYLGALRRELCEELGVRLNVQPLGILVYRHELQSSRTGSMVTVACYMVPSTNVSGEYSCKDGTAGVGWFDATALSFTQLAPADHANRSALLDLIGGAP
jgi:ADP-ribose pyrophosphatase YjhB (NUDIX family)